MHRLIFPVLGVVVLAGLVLLAQLFSAFQSEGLTPTSALMSAISADPLRWGYALVSGLVFIVFLAWLPFKLPEWLLMRRFRRVDSAVLDNDCELCVRFYRTLLDLRRRYGEARFMQRVATRFNFFYHYHTEALHWMNRIVRNADADSIPGGMITHSICAGHTGRVFAGSQYGGGLPSAFVRHNEAIYLLSWMDSVEVWSASSDAPICVFERDSLDLEITQRQPQLAIARLSGREKSSQKYRHLEMHLREINTEQQQMTVQNQVDALRGWLNELIPVLELRAEENFGIDVMVIDEAETPATNEQDPGSLAGLLEKLLGSHIDAVFGRHTLSISDPELKGSTVVLCSGLGIVLIEDMPLAGTIRYSGESQWMHTTAEGTNTINNACLAAQRGKQALISHLADAELNRWPVHDLVVFSHHNVQPELELGRQHVVQCDVITLGQLPKWFASQSVDDRMRFTKNDYNEFITLLDPARLRNKHARHA